MQLYQRLQALHPGASRRRLKQWLTASRVRVNGAIVRRGDVAVGVDDPVERIYVALVEGVVRRAEGTLTSRLIEDRALRVRTTDGRVGREAITRYRVLERRRNTTLLELQLVTGRRAQIRAQLAAAGHPIAGDREYGSRIDPLGRLALHATRLAFVHPRRGRLSFDSPAPATFGHRPG